MHGKAWVWGYMYMHVIKGPVYTVLTKFVTCWLDYFDLQTWKTIQCTPLNNCSHKKFHWLSKKICELQVHVWQNKLKLKLIHSKFYCQSTIRPSFSNLPCEHLSTFVLFESDTTKYDSLNQEYNKERESIPFVSPCYDLLNWYCDWRIHTL